MLSIDLYHSFKHFKIKLGTRILTNKERMYSLKIYDRTELNKKKIHLKVTTIYLKLKMYTTTNNALSLTS